MSFIEIPESYKSIIFIIFILILILFFHESIANLFQRIKKVKIGKNELEFFQNNEMKKLSRKSNKSRSSVLLRNKKRQFACRSKMPLNPNISSPPRPHRLT
jgi:Sec-independent protein translocase protein TatA